MAALRFQLRDLREEAKQNLEQQQQQQQQLVSLQQQVQRQQHGQHEFLQQQQQVLTQLTTVTNQISVLFSQAGGAGTPLQLCDRMSNAGEGSLAVPGAAAAAAAAAERETSVQFATRLKALTAEEKIDEAFGLAISADLEKETKGFWVNFICKLVNPDKIFDAEPPLLGQAALLGVGKGNKHPPSAAAALHAVAAAATKSHYTVFIRMRIHTHLQMVSTK